MGSEYNLWSVGPKLIGSRFRVQRLQLFTIVIKIRNVQHHPLGEKAL
jgi:hypothetical protein